MAGNPLADAARAAAGIPQDGAIPGAGADAGGGLGDLLTALKSGQISAERLMQLLALLAGAGQAPGGMMPQGGGNPIEQAMMMQGGGGGGGGYGG